METGLNRTGDGESGKREVGSGWQREMKIIIALCSRIGQDRMQSQTDYGLIRGLGTQVSTIPADAY